jgi:stress response protein YsnF
LKSKKKKRTKQVKQKKVIMAQTVIGIFNERDEPQEAVKELTSNGFTKSDIDVSNEGILTEDDGSEREDGDTFGERVERFFRNLFDDDDESTRYTNAAKSRFVVSVTARSSDEAMRASRILDEEGAIEVDDDSAATRSHERTASGDTTERTTADKESTSIPVVEEELNVGKREVETGRVRVRSRIIEKPVEQTLRLREEQVRVERTPADRPATERDFATPDRELEVRTTAEVPVVTKEARVVEEVRLDKDVREREEIVRDKVRRKDVEVDEESDIDEDVDKRSL